MVWHDGIDLYRGMHLTAIMLSRNLHERPCHIIALANPLVPKVVSA